MRGFHRRQGSYLRQNIPCGELCTVTARRGYKGDALLHITPFIRNIEKVLDALDAGYADREVLENAGRDVLIMLDALQKLSPYRWFDTDGEKKLISTSAVKNLPD